MQRPVVVLAFAVCCIVKCQLPLDVPYPSCLSGVLSYTQMENNMKNDLYDKALHTFSYMYENVKRVHNERLIKEAF